MSVTTSCNPVRGGEASIVLGACQIQSSFAAVCWKVNFCSLVLCPFRDQTPWFIGSWIFAHKNSFLLQISQPRRYHTSATWPQLQHSPQKLNRWKQAGILAFPGFFRRGVWHKWWSCGSDIFWKYRRSGTSKNPFFPHKIHTLDMAEKHAVDIYLVGSARKPKIQESGTFNERLFRGKALFFSQNHKMLCFEVLALFSRLHAFNCAHFHSEFSPIDQIRSISWKIGKTLFLLTHILVSVQRESFSAKCLKYLLNAEVTFTCSVTLVTAPNPNPRFLYHQRQYPIHQMRCNPLFSPPRHFSFVEQETNRDANGCNINGGQQAWEKEICGSM